VLLLMRLMSLVLSICFNESAFGSGVLDRMRANADGESDCWHSEGSDVDVDVDVDANAGAGGVGMGSPGAVAAAAAAAGALLPKVVYVTVGSSGRGNRGVIDDLGDLGDDCDCGSASASKEERSAIAIAIVVVPELLETAPALEPAPTPAPEPTETMLCRGRPRMWKCPSCRYSTPLRVCISRRTEVTA
jgi:hypothetical protein